MQFIAGGNPRNGGYRRLPLPPHLLESGQGRGGGQGFLVKRALYYTIDVADNLLPLPTNNAVECTKETEH